MASNCVYKPPSGNGLNTAYVTSSYGSGRIVAYDNVTANPSYASDYTVPATSACRSRTGDMSAAASDGNDRPTLAQAVNLRPNVLFIVSDDQAADTAIEDPYDGWANPMPEWAMGKTRDWFRDGRPGVAGGTEYSQAYATTPLCCPSRSSILSGQYAHNHDVQKNSQAITNLAEPLLSEYLAGAGYQTALYGKFLMDYTLSSQPVRGFREFGIFDLGYNRIPVREGTTSASGQTTSSTRMLSQYTTSYVRDQALAFLRRQNAAAKDGQPWFLYLAPFAPHELQTQAGNPPYPPGVTSPTPNFRYGPEAFQDMTTGSAHADDTPPPFEPRPAHHEPDRSDKPQWVVDNRDDRTIFEEPGFPGLREQQLRALRDVDDLVEAVFQELQAEGEGDETLAVYLSDNGYMWREHSPTVKATGVPNECYTDLHESDPPYPGHAGRPPRAPVPCGVAAKGIPYLNSIHVPMFVRWPGNPSVPRGVTNRNLTANVDLAPTVMDALGKTGEIPAAEPMDGRPLFGGGVRSMLLTEGWPQIGRPAWASVLTPPHVAGAYHYIWSETQPGRRGSESAGAVMGGVVRHLADRAERERQPLRARRCAGRGGRAARAGGPQPLGLPAQMPREHPDDLPGAPLSIGEGEAPRYSVVVSASPAVLLTGGAHMDIRYLGHSTFELIDGDARILVDPFLKPNSPTAPVTADEVDPTHILVTHGHVDHLADAAAVAKRTGAHCVALVETAVWLGGQGVENTSDPNLGGTVDFDWGWVKLVQAFHSSTTPDGRVTYASGLVINIGGRPCTTSATPACSAT